MKKERDRSFFAMLTASAAAVAVTQAAREAVYLPYQLSHPVPSFAREQTLDLSGKSPERYGVEKAAEMLDKKGKTVGYAVDGYAYGFNAKTPIRIRCRISPDGRELYGIELLSQSESEYYGDRIRLSSFQQQFTGRLYPLLLSSDSGRGTHIDGLTGATVTTRAALRLVDGAARFVRFQLQ